jgi:PBP1b-binding outer membrane lipoprotein LpoB
MKKTLITFSISIISLLTNSCSSDNNTPNSSNPNDNAATSSNSGEVDVYAALNYLTKIGIDKTKDKVLQDLNLPADANIISNDDTGLDVQYFKNDLIHHITFGFYGIETAQDFEVSISGDDETTLLHGYNNLKATIEEVHGLSSEDIVNEEKKSYTNKWFVDLFNIGVTNVAITVSLKNGVLSYSCSVQNEGI